MEANPKSTKESSSDGNPVTWFVSLPLVFKVALVGAIGVLLVVGASNTSTRDDALEENQVVLDGTVFAMTVPTQVTKVDETRVDESNMDETKVEHHIVSKNQFSIYDCAAYLHQEPGSLPNFLVIGVHKGGSTALYGFLAEHGQIQPAVCKETRFFTGKLFEKGLPFYRRHFSNLDGVPGLITGEGTPSYIRSPLALQRIRSTLPDIRIVVTFRDPAERFISNYVGFRERKKTPLTCDVFWAEELSKLTKCMGNYDEVVRKTAQPINLAYQSQANKAAAEGKVMTEEQTAMSQISKCESRDTECIKRHCYAINHENSIVRSIYTDQLVRWLLLYPKNQILVIQSEELYKDPSNTMQRVARFLKLRNYTAEELVNFEQSFKGSNHHKSRLSKTCNRDSIRAFFKSENHLLESIVKSQFPKIYARWKSWN